LLCSPPIPINRKGLFNTTNIVSKRSIEVKRHTIPLKFNETVRRRKRKVKGDKSFKWKTTINYFVDGTLNLDIVKKALLKIQEETCLKFVRRSQLYERMSGVHFINGKTCYSMVGKELGKVWQDVSIANYCQNEGGIQHEFLHALGIDHEHNRYDRDQFVSIMYNNIKPEEYSFFRQVKREDSSTLGIPYDYGSVMHYDLVASTARGEYTMIPKHKLYMKTIGQTKGVNFNDIKTLNYYYCRSECQVKIKCHHGGYQNPKNCKVCKCVKGFIGPRCNLLILPSPKCGKSVYIAKFMPMLLKATGIKDCVYHIVTPKNSKILLNIKFVSTYDEDGYACSPDEALEVKYWPDKTVTGARLCGVNKLINIKSWDHHLLCYRIGTIKREELSNDISKKSLESESYNISLKFNEILKRKKRKVKGDKSFKWDLKINYFIDNTLNLFVVKKALLILEEETCLDFVGRSQLYSKMSGIRFTRGNLCYSTVGKELGRVWQAISIGDYCQTIGGVLHEIIHALGIDHEHNRFDRDRYIKLIKKQIRSNEYNFFRKVSLDDSETFGISYDFGSLMHYDVEASSKNDKSTMIPKDKLYTRTIGQLKSATFNDIKTINYYYCKYQCLNKIKCYHGGYQNPRNCKVCKCVEGFIGPHCNLLSLPSYICGKTVYIAKSIPIPLKAYGNKKCVYHIVTDKKKYVYTNDYNERVCSPDDSLEVKYWPDKTVTGARFCGSNNKFINIKSLDHHVIVYFKSTMKNSGFLCLHIFPNSSLNSFYN
uniref:Metalloendopeptidase n=1 Tax=Strongyloides stercoralis TaxID=6248 RepID=A0AAF5I2K0_STRER